MLVELHTLTAHAPSNLNRDDFGRPKTALFGGAERARISSQSLKRAIRTSPYLASRLEGKLSTRSRDIPQLVYDRLAERYAGDDAKLGRLQTAAEGVTNALGKPIDKKTPLRLAQIVFLTPDELSRITEHVAELVEGDGKLDAKKIGKSLAQAVELDRTPGDAADMALFGRMTTDDANKFSSVDAAMQVMHPLSTHAVSMESDYFTAVDDVTLAKGERGTAHLDALDFNSAVYYKYFSCNLDLLAKNMGGDASAALDALTAFLDAACRVTPSGKQNSFASHSFAATALLVLRPERTPCSLADAFERPVAPSERGFLAPSTEALAQHYCTLVADYGLERDEAILFARGADALSLPEAPCYTVAETLDAVWDFLAAHASTEAPASR